MVGQKNAELECIGMAQQSQMTHRLQIKMSYGTEQATVRTAVL
jgi:hypothetical protein